VSEPPLELRALAAGYDGKPALEGVDLVVSPGESIAVLGPNGGGKTTLFRAILGELPPLAGERILRTRPAYVAQGDRARLDFPVSALEVVLMGTLAGGRWWRPAGRDDRRAAREALERVGLADQAGTLFGALSGGQRRRVLVARALVQQSGLLLLDEPLAGVDRTSAQRILGVLDELRGEGRAVLVSTHDIEGARRFDRVLCLNHRPRALGPPGTALGRAELEATYGREIVVLDEPGQPARAVTVQHHEH
jgi:manganese/iron transport system ATP-binding protein/manganese/zinc/iron transport system ATP- binding protein